MAALGRPGQYDQMRVYRATIYARNQFTMEFAQGWTDIQIRILALIKQQFRKADHFNLAGEAAAQYALVSRRSWITTIKQLEKMGLIKVNRIRIAYQKNLVNCYGLTDKFNSIIQYAHSQMRYNAAPSKSTSKKSAENKTKKFDPNCANVAHNKSLYNKQYTKQLLSNQ